MRDLTLKAKVPESRFESVVKGLTDMPDWYIQAVAEFYARLMANEFRLAVEAFKPMHGHPEMWTMYQLLGASNFPEQKTLNKRFATLQKTWKDQRPRKRRQKSVERKEDPKSAD